MIPPLTVTILYHQCTVMNKPLKSNGVYLATLEQFKYFGDISLLSNTNRNADVVAATDVTCYVLNKGIGFMDLIPFLRSLFLISVHF